MDELVLFLFRKNRLCIVIVVMDCLFQLRYIQYSHLYQLIAIRLQESLRFKRMVLKCCDDTRIQFIYLRKTQNRIDILKANTFQS
jgi:hypothetical protein